MSSPGLPIFGSKSTSTVTSDRLFCFTSSQLTVVNVAQDYEFLEGTFQGHGIDSSKQLVEVNEGIAFVNSTGVYYFDGNKMESLSDDLMMTSTKWATATNIAYLPQEKLICVWHTTDDIMSYSLATKAWVGDSITNTAPNTTVKFKNNIPFWLVDGSPDVLYKLQIAHTGASDGFEMTTGKISCGDLSRNKKFKKVYITCANGAQFNLHYTIDSGVEVNAGTLVDGLSTFVINTSGKTIQLRITSTTTIDDSTSISDISLIYRDKTVK